MSLILSGTDGLSDVDGTASTPAIRGTDTNTGIFFPAADTIAFAEGGAEVARFNASGQLALGSTTADGRLKVVETATGAGVTLYSSNDNSAGQIGTTNEAGTENSININAYRGSGKILFSTSNTERMRIDSLGNLLVGTSSNPLNCRLNVVGRDSPNPAAMGAQPFTNGSYALGIQNASGTNVGGIIANSSSTAYNTSSDYRLKENIVPMTGALDKVSALKPVTYTWKADGSDGQGFIAHELQEVVPDCVTGEKDAVDAEGNPVYQGIDTSFLVATLTAALQEQQAIITDLKSRIEALEVK